MAVSADVVGLTGSSSHVVLAGVRALLGGSHDDLRLRADQLSWSLSVVFFTGGGAGLGPDGSVLVCADVPPLGAALRGKQRTAVRVAVNEADHGACGCSNDIFRDVMRLLSVTSCFSGHLSRPTGCSSPMSSSIPLPRLQAGPYFGCWVRHGAAMSVVHALLFASHEDLRVHHLSHSLSSAFFADGAVAAPFRRRSYGGGLAGGAS
uniref:Uncharacterized protein n=1 Tax=Oryza glumipatula TaxID=40148 RepID=A0A0E0B0R0_9ORYZ